MSKCQKKQRGAVLVLSALLMLVLVGIGALALDLGRLHILHTQMENAVDAAALAAAKELDGSSGAIQRAMTAAREALLHETPYTGDDIDNLLRGPGDVTQFLPDTAFTFYRSIDPLPRDVITDPTEYGADAEARFVRVELGHVDAPRHIDLYFLPVLRLFGLNVPVEAEARVAALAGSTIGACNIFPIYICNPFEDPNNPDSLEYWKDNTRLPPGTIIALKEQQTGGGGSATWSPGGWGWLDPMGADNTKDNFQMQMADPSAMECVENIRIGHRTGQNLGAEEAINTRFGIYPPGHAFLTESNYTAASIVVDYPRDNCMANSGAGNGNCLDGNDRFGLADWGNRGVETITDPGPPPSSETGITPSRLTRDAFIQVFHGGTTPNGSTSKAPRTLYGKQPRFELYRAALDIDAKDDWEKEIPGSFPTPPDLRPVYPLSSGMEDASPVSPYVGVGCDARDDLAPNKDCCAFEASWHYEASIKDICGKDPNIPLKEGYITYDPSPATQSASDDYRDPRVVAMIMLNCQSAELHGTDPGGYPLMPQDGIAKIFLSEHMRTVPNNDLYVEWMGFYQEFQDEHLSNIVQLYDID